MDKFYYATEQGTIAYLSSWIEDMEDRIRSMDGRSKAMGLDRVAMASPGKQCLCISL